MTIGNEAMQLRIEQRADLKRRIDG